MTIRNLEKIKRLSSHPLEEVLNIEPESTEITVYERNTELKPYDPFGEKDSELETQYQEIADLAISTFKKIDDVSRTADTKLVARLSEVQMQTLNTALSAIEKRTKHKENKDRDIARERTVINKACGKVTNKIIAVIDRNSALKQITALMNQDEPDIIEGEVISDENNTDE